MRSRLLVFGSFAHDAKGVLTAIGRLAFVGVERGFNGLLGSGLELRIAAFAHADHWRVFFDDSKLAFPHEISLAHVATGTESL